VSFGNVIRNRKRHCVGGMQKPALHNGVPQQILRLLIRSASFLSNNRVIFNIKGNDFRLVVAVRYTQKILFIRFVGTHAEYDRINAEII